MNEQSATLQRAMDALNSICLKPRENIVISPKDESPKPASVSPDPGALGRITAAGDIPIDDPAEWREPFARWMNSDCVSDPRCSSGVGCLHIAFCEWAITQNDVPCKRFPFECMLRESGFPIDEISGEVMVFGLILRGDFEASGL